jgi:hypothetical protein
MSGDSSQIYTTAGTKSFVQCPLMSHLRYTRPPGPSNPSHVPQCPIAPLPDHWSQAILTFSPQCPISDTKMHARLSAYAIVFVVSGKSPCPIPYILATILSKVGIVRNKVFGCLAKDIRTTTSCFLAGACYLRQKQHVYDFLGIAIAISLI